MTYEKSIIIVFIGGFEYLVELFEKVSCFYMSVIGMY